MKKYRIAKYFKDLKFYLIAALSGLCFSMSFNGYDLPLPRIIANLSTPFLFLFVTLAVVTIYVNIDNIFNLYQKNRKTFILLVLLVALLVIFVKIQWPAVTLILLLSFYPNRYRLASAYLFFWPLFFFSIIVFLGLLFPDLGRESIGKVSSFFGSVSGLKASSLGFTNPNHPMFLLTIIAINGGFLFARSLYKRPYAISMILLATLVYFFTLSRTSYLVIMTFLMLYLLGIRQVYIFLKKAMPVIVILFTALSFFVAINYGEFNNPVNGFLTNRPYYWNLRVQDGIASNVFGDKDKYEDTGRPESALDNNYINLISRYGWVVFVVVFYLLLNGKRKINEKDDEAYILGLFAIMVYFLSESMPFSMTLCIVLILSMQKKFLLVEKRDVIIKNLNEKVSVVVPVFNGERYLRDCIESILIQTYRNIEIIIVNDGSTDSSGVIADDYAKKDGRIKTIHRANGGVSHARNSALDIATGIWVMFVDADDMIPDNSIETMLRTAIDLKVNCVCGMFQLFSNDDSDNLLRRVDDSNNIRVLDKKEAIGALLYQGGVANALFPKLYNRRAIGKNRFHKDISVAEDLLFNYMVLKNISKVALISNITYFYRKHPNSVINSSFSIKRMSGLRATGLILDDIQSQDLPVNPAINRHFMESLFILSQLESKRVHPQSYQECISVISNYNVPVMMDSQSPVSYRFFALISKINPILAICAYKIKINTGRILKRRSI